MVVDIPFETREVDVHISARSPGYVAHYRRTDGAVLSVVAGPRAEDIDLRYSAAFADERVLQRFKYGYLRSAQWFSDCGVASSAFAWRVDRNRVVSVWGTVDRASAVAVLRSVERVTSKRWHEVTDPVADQPVPDQTDPCRFIDN